MGHFTHNCKLTGIPIRNEAVLIVMKPSGKLYDNSEESIAKYGKTYMCSNDGTKMKFTPVWFPLKGHYDDYGGLERIQKTENTRIIEEYYGLTIEEIVAIVCSGRKDDGYDGALNVIKKPVVIPEDRVEGEDHFNFYQRTQNDPMPFGNGVYPDVGNGGKKPWRIFRDGKLVSGTKKEYDADFKLIHEQYARYNAWKESGNSDPLDDYGKPQYEERYKELLTYSGMWVHGKVYDNLTKVNNQSDYDKLNLGTPQLLETLGFEHIGQDKTKERYDQEYTKDGVSVYSDGTWIDIGSKESVYNLPQFKKWCEKNGVEIFVNEINSWSRVEQMCRLVIPKMEVPLNEEEKKMSLKEIKAALSKAKDGYDEELLEAYSNIMTTFLSREISDVYYTLLNGNFNSHQVENPLTVEYFKAVHEGKMIDEVVDFWTFDGYMYTMGAYYEIVGTGPQDGDYQGTQKVLKVALDIVDEYVKEYEEEMAEYEE